MKIEAFANLRSRINKKKKNANFQISLTYWMKEYQNFKNHISVFKSDLGFGMKSEKVLEFPYSLKNLIGLSIPDLKLRKKKYEKEFFGFHPSIITGTKKDENGNPTVS